MCIFKDLHLKWSVQYSRLIYMDIQIYSITLQFVEKNGLRRILILQNLMHNEIYVLRLRGVFCRIY